MTKYHQTSVAFKNRLLYNIFINFTCLLKNILLSLLLLMSDFTPTDTPSAPVPTRLASKPIPDIKTFLLAIGGVVVMWLPVLLLHLTLVLFSALIAYALTRSIADWLRKQMAYLRPSWRGFQTHQLAEWLALAGWLLITVVLVVLTGDWVAEKMSVDVFGKLVEQITLVLDQLHRMLPDDVARHVPSSVSMLQTQLLAMVKTYAPQLQLAGIHTLRGLGYVLIGTVIGSMMAVQITPRPRAPLPPIVSYARGQFDELTQVFGDVFFAQVKISTINTFLTAVYLLGILPLVGHPLPMAWTVVLITFACGLIPVVGNLVSNVIIVLLSLTHGLGVSLASLAWLVSIHKLEYFLNAQIIGHRIHAAAWELLIMMLLFEATFGIAGLVAAPVIYAQIKRVLLHRGWL